MRARFLSIGINFNLGMQKGQILNMSCKPSKF